MEVGAAIFRGGHEIYHADTCDPLRQAAERGDVRLVARARGAYPGQPLPPRVVPEVRTVGYWDADRNQAWGLDWHRNEGIELTFVARGKVQFTVDDQRFLLKRGDLTITRPWQMHRVGDPHVGACRLHWLILDVGVRRPNQQWQWPKWLASSEMEIAYLTSMLSHNEQPVWEAEDEVEQYFEKLGEATASFDEQIGEGRLKLHISGLIVAITDLLRRHQPALDTSLSSTQRTVELFLASLVHGLEQPWDVPSMSAACGLGRSRFSHYCKEITNMSPNEYLTCCRLDAAVRRLADNPCESVTDVAMCCGFGSAQYFATVFHEHHGCSPREYRARLLRLKTGSTERPATHQVTRQGVAAPLDPVDTTPAPISA